MRCKGWWSLYTRLVEVINTAFSHRLWKISLGTSDTSRINEEVMKKTPSVLFSPHPVELGASAQNFHVF